MKSDDQTGLQFYVQFDEAPDKPMSLQVVVFDRSKNVIYQSEVNENSFSLPFAADELKDKRIFLAANIPDRKNELTVETLEKGNGFEVNLPPIINPAETIKLNPVPKYIWSWWWFCVCHVRGRVFNRCGNEYLPVYKARVNICEVDPVIWYIRKLPDDEIFKLRDDILGKIIEWHLPDPPPEKLKDIIINPAIKQAAIQPITADVSSLKLTKGSTATADKLASTQTDILSKITSAKLDEPTIKNSDKAAIAPTLPQENIASFHSDSAYLVRNYLVDNYTILYPYWCWLYPLFLRCVEVAVVETDAYGWFNTDVAYSCYGDKPDLYFSVDYYINGVWTTVYNPGLGCGTYWDYSCNSEVDIYLNDQRIPCPIPQPNIGNKDVFIFSIGNNVSVTKVYQDGSMKGQTMPGTPFEEGSPFGGSIEPRVYFGNYLCDAIDGGNNYFYKWSFRKEGTSTWNEIIADTFRHYLVETSDGPVFPVYRIGANTDKLYQILRYHLPGSQGGNDLWVIDSRTDTASTKFLTTVLDLDSNGIIDDFSLTDGAYEIKMELYKYVENPVTHVLEAQRVNWTGEGINLYVPLHTLTSPFGDVTIEHETDSTIINKYKYFEGTDLYGFTMKIFIDNKAPNLLLEDVSVTNADATTGVAGPCGFIEFKNRNTSTVNFKFNASQQNNFATFGFGITKGNGTTDNFSAGARVGVSSTLLLHNGLLSGTNINLVGSDYELHVSPDFLLGSCDKAAFLQSVSIHPLVQDGYSRIIYDSSLATAFALEHHS
jgi:hypothetical protein